jgi:hypothetical protein
VYEEQKVHPFLISAPDRIEGSVSYPAAVSTGTNPGTLRIGDEMGLTADLDVLEKTESLLLHLGFEIRTFPHVAQIPYQLGDAGSQS